MLKFIHTSVRLYVLNNADVFTFSDNRLNSFDK